MYRGFIIVTFIFRLIAAWMDARTSFVGQRCVVTPFPLFVVRSTVDFSSLHVIKLVFHV